VFGCLRALASVELPAVICFFDEFGCMRLVLSSCWFNLIVLCGRFSLFN
jgi:hypothetical protein